MLFCLFDYVFSLSVVRLLIEVYKTILVFWSSEGLDTPVSTYAESTIITVSEWRSLNKTYEYIFLVISLSEELKVAWIVVVADGLQDHGVSFLEGNVANVFHGLHKRYNSPVSLLSLILKIHGQTVPMGDVIARPEKHHEHPREEELWEATIDKWLIVEKS